MTDLGERFSALREVITEAGERAAEYFQSPEMFSVDGGRKPAEEDVTTSADREIEALIISRLGSRFPGDQFLGEETGGTQVGSKDQLWIIDPIDGTRNFARGESFFCVSIAFIEGGLVSLGAIYHPASRDLFIARRGHGATLNDRPMRVKDPLSVENAVLGNDIHPDAIAESEEVRERLEAAGAEQPILGAGALAMAHVAAGRLDGYWNLAIASWDVAAALLLVREAGGYATSFRTWGDLYKRQGVLVCGPTLKATLLAVTGLPH